MCKDRKETSHGNEHILITAEMSFNIFMPIGRINFECKGCWVVSFNFIKILKVHFENKLCRN